MFDSNFYSLAAVKVDFVSSQNHSSTSLLGLPRTCLNSFCLLDKKREKKRKKKTKMQDQ